MKSKEPAYYRLPINAWPADDRPREKLMELGPFKLSDTELLAILIQSGVGNFSAIDVARRLLKQAGGLGALSHMDYHDIIKLKIRGIGKAKAVIITAAMHMAQRIQSEIKKPVDKIIRSSDEVAQIYGPRLCSLKKEVFMAVLLASNNRIIKDKIITEGTINASVITPREVFYEALVSLAAAIILIHNHPSGNTSPSREDINITRKMVATGKAMSIPVLDHIIIAADNYTSFADKGLLS